VFVSYAQNFEDVLLMRALRSVERGSYVDIGANDPVSDSVSLAFYERGWRGVHVEPVPLFAQRLRAARPDEEVVEAAVSSERNEATFFQIGDTGLGTGEGQIAEGHREAGFPVEEIRVRTVQLDEVLARFAGRELHWLKIDVEGAEADALASWAETDVRPWIILVEATRPGTQESSHEAWESGLLSKGYRFAYFDGVNRFYVSDRKLELLGAFGPGPNVFDDFVLNGTASSPFAVFLNERLRLAAAELSGVLREVARLTELLEATREAEKRHEVTHTDLAAARSEIVGLQELLAAARDLADAQALTLAERDASIRHLRAMDEARSRLLREAARRLDAAGAFQS
jgi:FkbM family methyltransferase